MVRHGDPTTTGGFVMAFSSTMFDDNKRIALHGDEATCGNCKGSFKIFGTRTHTTENGRAIVLHGDSVMCPCGKNKVTVGSSAGCFVDADRDASRTNSATAASPDQVPTPDAHDQHFLLRDERTGEPLIGMPYKITTEDGQEAEGHTDASGHTQKIVGEGAQQASITVFEGHAPINPDWDK